MNSLTRASASFAQVQDILLQFPDKKHPPLTKHLLALSGVSDKDAGIIAKMLDASLVFAPPPQIDNWRTQFDAMPAAQREALLEYGDYLLAQKIVFAGVDLMIVTGERALHMAQPRPDMLRPPRVTAISGAGGKPPAPPEGVEVFVLEIGEGGMAGKYDEIVKEIKKFLI